MQERRSRRVEKDLAAGEDKLADGYKQYNQGKKDYKAAPAKLAAAKKQIAQGEKDLAAGEAALATGKAQYAQGQADYKAAPAKLAAGQKAVSGLDQLIKGLEKAKTGFDSQWQPGFEKKATKPDGSDAGLQQARTLITNTLNGKQDDVALIETVAGKEGLLDNVNDDASYASFDTALNDLVDAFTTAADTLTQFSALATSKAEDSKLTALKAGLMGATKDTDAEKAQVQGMDLNTMQGTYDNLNSQNLEAKKTAAEEGIKNLEKLKAAGYEYIPKEDGSGFTDVKVADKLTETETLLATVKGYISTRDGLKTLIDGRTQAASEIGAFAQQAGDKLGLVAKLSPELAQALNTSINTLAANSGSTTNKDYASAIDSLQGALTQLAAALDEKVKEIENNKKPLAAWDDGYQQLKAGQEDLAGSEALPYAFKQMLANETIRKTLNDKAPKLIPALTLYSSGKLAGEDMDDFDSDMKTVSSNVIPSALKILRAIKGEANNQLAAGKADYKAAPAKLATAKAQIAQGESDLAAGRNKLSAGKKEYAQGLADYKAAPAKLAAAKKALAKGEKDLAAGKAKLADGKAQYAQGLADFAAAPAKLADGRAKLADAEKQLADGRQELADGKAKLAEYEDGEQQVRDGLATLMATEPDGGLTSILDRRNGDADFDNGDNHLELDEGLEAVEVGRGYQADSGVLITKEITNRAVGTAAGLGAGALAVLAAILSFLRKNKGAGISALLAAAAGGAGIAVGTSAGTEFSSIAGSLVGATPWIAFGVLGGVALVHAIAHFASKNA